MYGNIAGVIIILKISHMKIAFVNRLIKNLKTAFSGFFPVVKFTESSEKVVLFTKTSGKVFQKSEGKLFCFILCQNLYPRNFFFIFCWALHVLLGKIRFVLFSYFVPRNKFTEYLGKCISHTHFKFNIFYVQNTVPETKKW